MVTAEPLLLPVGHDLGVRYAGERDRRQQVRSGLDLVELSDQEFAIWLLAHGVNAEDRPTRASVLCGWAAQDPDQYAVGLPGRGAVAFLDPDAYELWQWGSVAPTLWHSCELLASVTSRVERPLTAADALGAVLGDLRFLVAHGCVYLDVVAAG